jgi:hypothetical protein
MIFCSAEMATTNCLVVPVEISCSATGVATFSSVAPPTAWTAEGDDSLTATANAQAGERGQRNASHNLVGGDGHNRLTADAFGRASAPNQLHGGSENA